VNWEFRICGKVGFEEEIAGGRWVSSRGTKDLVYDYPVDGSRLVPKISRGTSPGLEPSGHPSEEAATKLMYLALRNVIQKWDMVLRWKQALNHCQMLWGDHIQTALNR
jgi:hypothetical protein